MPKWIDILKDCGVHPRTAGRWAPVFERQITQGSFSLGGKEVDDFLANVLHESAKLESLAENLNYSVEALLNKFGRHRISEADARRYGRTATRPADQKAIANCLYGGEWGLKNLGNTEPNDGWDMRGSGLIQATGRANIRLVGQALGIPKLETEPHLLREDPDIALAAAIAWWERRVPDSAMGNIPRTRKVVNGGTLGLADVTKLTAAADAADGRLDGALS